MSYACASGLYDQVRSIQELTLLPDTVWRVLGVVGNESSTALDLASEIDLDPCLAGRMLRLVNSSSYGGQGGITSIPDAAILLGFDEVERIALAVSFVSVFGKDQPGVRGLRTFWRHSVATSIAAHLIEQHNREAFPQLQGAHIAGLLHDMGRAVIALHFPEEQARIDHLVASGATLLDAERETLDGATHAEVGAWLAAGWGLPEPVVKSIGMHHQAAKASSQLPMVHATHLADCLARQLGYTDGREEKTEQPHPFSCKLMGYCEPMINQVAFMLSRSRCLMGAVAMGAMFSTSDDDRY